MIFIATEGATYSVRDGQGLAAPVKKIGPHPVPFVNLTAAQAKELGADVKVFETEAEAKKHASLHATKRMTPSERKRGVQIKVACDRTKLIGGRKGIEPEIVEGVAAQVRKAMAADERIVGDKAVNELINAKLDAAVEAAEASNKAKREAKAARVAAGAKAEKPAEPEAPKA